VIALPYVALLHLSVNIIAVRFIRSLEIFLD
jgi:hypothetical protein